MKWLLFLVSLPCVQMVGILTRLATYWPQITLKQRRRLYVGYGLVFLMEFVSLQVLALSSVTLSAYKLMVILGSIVLFVVDCVVLRRDLFARLFFFAMQSNLNFFLHSISAFFIGYMYGQEVTLPLLTIQSFATTALFFLFAWPLTRMFKKPIIAFRFLAGSSYYWNIIWLVPAFMFLANFIITLNPVWIGGAGLLARCMAAAAIYVIFRCITLDYVQHQKQEQTEQDNRLLSVQAQAMADHLSAFRENENQMQRFRHDFRHQLRLLGGLLAQDDKQGLRGALASMDNSLIELHPLRFCQNNIINAALRFYAADAQKKGVACEIEVDFPEEMRVDALQLAVVLSNGMENAIRESLLQQEKTVILHSRCSEGKIALDIRNRFDGTVYFDSEGIPATQKEGHGTGIRSILAFTGKHHGICNFSHENGWFVLSMMVEDR